MTTDSAEATAMYQAPLDKYHNETPCKSPDLYLLDVVNDKDE